jgi:photosystem II stability/assembly factor-like uncharacterized protein
MKRKKVIQISLIVFCSIFISNCGLNQSLNPTAINNRINTQISLSALAQPPTNTFTEHNIEEITPTLQMTLIPEESLLFTNIQMFADGKGWGIEKSRNILHTIDGGKTWENVSPPINCFTKNGFFALNGDTAWAVLPVSWSFGESYEQKCKDIKNRGLIWRTRDGGRSWEQGNKFVSEVTTDYESEIEPISIQFINVDEGYLSWAHKSGTKLFTSVLMKTSDGGMTWRGQFRQEKETIFGGLIFLNSNIGFMGSQYIGEINTSSTIRQYIDGDLLPILYQTLDGGLTWNYVNLPRINSFYAKNVSDYPGLCETSDVHRFNEQTMGAIVSCVGNDFHIIPIFYFTPDGGVTWRSWPSLGYEYFLNRNIGWRSTLLGDYHAVWSRTLDGGITWEYIGKWDAVEVQFNFIDKNNGWIIMYGRLFRTFDGGKTFKNLNPIMNNE